MKTFLAILFCFGLPLLAGAIGGIASANAPEFYRTLEQPAWAPPSWLFGPVWTALYLMMGIAAFLVWRARGWSAALLFYAVHMFFNGLWSWLFFHWGLMGWAFVEIVLLWVMIAVLTIWFMRIRRAAGLLLVPYWAWVTYASALNFELWRRNG